MSMYFPNGSADEWWTAATFGTGSAWSTSAILEPLLPSRQYLLGLNNVGNYSSMVPQGFANPSHGTNCGGAWHCYDPRQGTSSNVGGGISVDQVIANQIGKLTPLPSLQVVVRRGVVRACAEHLVVGSECADVQGYQPASGV
jgi:hypothetical protein